MLNHTSSPNSPSHTHTHTNSTPSPSLKKAGNGASQVRGMQNGGEGPSPRPKRKAPAPPTNAAASQKSDHYNSLRKSRNLRSSKEDLLGDYQGQTLPATRDRSHTTGVKGGKSGSHSQNHVGTQQQGYHNRTQTAEAHSSSSPKKSRPRRSSENLLNSDQASVSSTFSSHSSTYSSYSSQQPQVSRDTENISNQDSP